MRADDEESVMRGRPDRLILGGLLLLFLIKGLLYASLIPFNGHPDEAEHLTQIRISQHWNRIAAGEADAAQVTRETVEAYRKVSAPFPEPPPRLGGVLTGTVPTPKLRSLYYRALGLTMRWLGIQDPLAAWRLARKLSILSGLAVLLLTWLTARTVFPGRLRPALLATGLVALLPQFGAMSTAVNPDGLAVVFGAVFFYAAARICVLGPDKAAIILGIGLVLVLPFTKKTVFFTLPLFLLGGAAWLRAVLKDNRRFLLLLLAGGVVFLGVLALLAYYPPTAELFVSLFGLPLIRSWGPGFDPLLFRQDGILDLLVKEVRLLDPLFWLHLKSLGLVFFKSFWAYFGYLEAPLAWWWYALLLLLCLAGAGGFGVWLVRSAPGRARQALILMALGVLSSLAFIFIRQVVFSPGSLAQGRHLFPALVPLALCWAAGFLRLWPERLRGWSLAGVLAFLWLLDLKALFGVAVPWFYRLYL